MFSAGVLAREFARHGFFRDVDYDASYITAWAVCFHKVNQPVHQLAYDYERRYWLLWKENTDLRTLSNELRDQVRAITQKVAQFGEQEVNSAEAIRKLTFDLDQTTEDLEKTKNQAEPYIQRWNALEKTRTWKILAWFHKLGHNLNHKDS